MKVIMFIFFRTGREQRPMLSAPGGQDDLPVWTWFIENPRVEADDVAA